ncbi:MAG: protein translocase subunit SecF [Streptosporangiales bacterium]
MSRLGGFGARLHRGEVSYEFIGRRRLWFLVSAILIVLCAVSLSTRQLNFGVEFSGGSIFTFSAPNTSKQEVETTVEQAGVDQAVVQSVNQNRWRVQTESLSGAEVTQVQKAIADETGIGQNDVSQEQIGPSWGIQVSKKAGLGLLIFLVVCAIFLWVVFEWKMAVAAMVALLHDLVITAGVYSVVGFEVTPATVIGFLTILGYSLYDTVVVFDKVRDNTAGILGGSRHTFSSASNLAVNQTLARSINTSIVALLPVAAILAVSVGVLGAGTLQDLSLALFTGILTGTYSSIFIATPLLAVMKEREPQMAALRRRVTARRAAQGASGEEEEAARDTPARAAKAKSKSARAGDDRSRGTTATATRTKADTAANGAGDETGEEPASESNGTASKVTVTGVPGSGGGSGASGKQSQGTGKQGSSANRRGGGRPQPRRSGSKSKSKSKKKKR